MNTVVTAHSRTCADGRVGDLVHDLRAKLPGAEPVVVLVLASAAVPLRVPLAAAQRAFPQSVCMGASTAGEFTEKAESQGGLALWALCGDYHLTARMAKGLGQDLSRAVATAIEGQAQPMEGYPCRTGFILLDPLSSNAEETTLSVSAALGPDTPLVGGAAADDLQMVSTEVGLGRDAQRDALVVAVLHSKAPLGVGVAHGHVPYSEPITVTRSQGSVVYELNHRPAWDVWVEHTAARCRELGIDASQLSTTDAVFEFLNRFEGGLTLGEDYKVRVPMSRGDDGAIHFACGIPEGVVLRIMESAKENQVESAREAVRRSLRSLGPRPAAGALVFDCSCRKTILKEEFEQAVMAMADELGDKPFAGFETYGEIALQVGSMSGFHNTTTVVVTFAA